MSHKYVYFFGDNKADGDATMKTLLGGKGDHHRELRHDHDGDAGEQDRGEGGERVERGRPDDPSGVGGCQKEQRGPLHAFGRLVQFGPRCLPISGL